MAGRGRETDRDYNYNDDDYPAKPAQTKQPVSSKQRIEKPRVKQAETNPNKEVWVSL